ncbi:MAG: BACON domain-containing protein [Clostridia bacterium]|nr:BACON domain-containing protein [Clostridia bacterium]
MACRILEYNEETTNLTKGAAMQKKIGFVLLILCLVLLSPAALAQIGLELSMEQVPMETPVDFIITGEAADTYRYTLKKDGKALFTTETVNAFGAYLPREKGDYHLEATALNGDVETSVTATFSVVDKLTLTHAPIPEAVAVGSAAEATLKVTGGTPPYRFAYAITQDGQVITEQATASDHWYWAPTLEGEYTLHMAVIDSQGATVMQHQPLTVEASQGLALVHSGGGLCAHGGQESWMVCATDPWTAETTANFLRIETPSGNPGDMLVVTALSDTKEYRQGTILLTSGSQQLEWPVSQSGDHGIEEEVFLFTREQPLYIDQQQHAVWPEASGSRTFMVGGGNDWVISVDGDFIEASGSGDSLTVTVTASDSASVRSGLVTLIGSAGCGYLHIYQSPGDQSAAQTATGIRWSEVTIHSQFSGLWKEAKYSISTLEHSGCAIFALSHAMDWLRVSRPETLPQALATKYAFCLRDGGTINSTLVGNAGDDLGFKTRFDLYTERGTIRDRLEKGAVFSFAVVNGHIALVVEVSDDGSMMRIIDSAPSATWERIQNAQLFQQKEDGTFSPIASLSELEGIRYYPENDAFGGTSYWLESSYVAKRGVRLIQLREEE